MPPFFLGPLTQLRCIAIKNFYPENFDPLGLLGISKNNLMASWGGNKLKADTHQQERVLSFIPMLGRKV